MAGAHPEPKEEGGIGGHLIRLQEQVAYVYGWSPSELDDLPLDELEMWAEAAKARERASASRHRCAFMK